MSQIAGLLDDLDDNLDEYGRHHEDVRKALPKLITATERWGTVLKSPSESRLIAYSESWRSNLSTMFIRPRRR